MAKKSKSSKTPTRARIRATAIRKLSEDGRVKASDLVKAAENPNHPMHKDFEWDNTKAGHQHRLNQARTYISEVRVIITTSTKRIVVPCYVKDADVSPREGYIETARLQTNEEAASRAFQAELVRLQAQLERCREFAAALELEDELNAALNAITTMSGRIRRRGTGDDAGLGAPAP